MGNMKEIARLAGVSLGTVSNVFSGSAAVREPLRRKVMLAVEATGYQPNQLARGLRRDKTNMIAIVIPDIRDPFFPPVVRGAEDVAFANGYRLVICNTDNDHEKELSQITELRTYLPAGLMVIASNVSEFTAQAESLRRSGTSVVCVDCLPRGWIGDTLTLANERGAYQLTKHALKLGHRRIAMIAGPQSFPTFQDRLKGFRRALAEQNIEIDPDYIQEALPDIQGGYTKADSLMQIQPRPTAIIAGNDVLALGAMKAFLELGLRCPEDVSLAGFDDLDCCEMVNPPLTTVAQPGYELGAAAARLLIARINGDTEQARHIILDTTLRIRGSLAPPAKAKRTVRQARNEEFKTS
jgi:DNA-binding LacI/PurR family transcriptional regulator